MDFSLHKHLEICNSDYGYLETNETGSRRSFIYYLNMVLQMHLAGQGNTIPRVGTIDRLTVWVVAEMLTMEVPFKVAVTGESLQSISSR